MRHTWFNHNKLRTGFTCLPAGHSRTDAILPRHITGSCDHPPLAAAHNNRLIPKLRIIPFLHRTVKRIAINMRQMQFQQFRMTYQPVMPAVRTMGKGAARRYIAIGKTVSAQCCYTISVLCHSASRHHICEYLRHDSVQRLF